MTLELPTYVLMLALGIAADLMVAWPFGVNLGPWSFAPILTLMITVGASIMLSVDDESPRLVLGILAAISLVLLTLRAVQVI